MIKIIKYKYNNKYILNYKLLLNHGFHFGGNKKILNIRNSSIIHSKKLIQYYLNLNLTIIQLNKIMKILEIISYKRGTLYFINNFIGFNFKINNIYKKAHLHPLINKRISNSFYIFSKWNPGFLTNNFCFFSKLKKKIRYPRLPNFNTIGDSNINYISIDESNKLLIPFSYSFDINAKFNKYFYGLPFNTKSIDSLIYILN